MITTMNILVTVPVGDVREIFLPAENRRLLESMGQVTWNPHGRQYTAEEIAPPLKKADAVVTGWGNIRITGELIGEERPGIVAHTGGTVAPFVDEELFRKGFRVVCANEVFAKSVAEGTLCYMLAGQRRLAFWDRTVRRGEWRDNRMLNAGLAGKRVGLSGFGAITRYLCEYIKPFDVELLICSAHMDEEALRKINAKKASLDEIFSTCDVISLHNSLTERTRHLVDARLLGMIRKDALLINTSRGAVVDEEALCRELATGRFQAVLDVFEQEPLAADSPLRSFENVTVIPHMAGPTADLYQLAGRTVIEEIGRVKAGEALLHEIKAEDASHMTAKG
jgi:phosphoglycerate dehydrogenase-like enzyme